MNRRNISTADPTRFTPLFFPRNAEKLHERIALSFRLFLFIISFLVLIFLSFDSNSERKPNNNENYIFIIFFPSWNEWDISTWKSRLIYTSSFLFSFLFYIKKEGLYISKITFPNNRNYYYSNSIVLFVILTNDFHKIFACTSLN